MKALKFLLLGVSGLGLLFLGACSGGRQTASNPPSSAPAEKTTAESPKSGSETSEASKGGQVVESGPYHLEFVPEKEARRNSLRFLSPKGRYPYSYL